MWLNTTTAISHKNAHLLFLSGMKSSKETLCHSFVRRIFVYLAVVANSRSLEALRLHR